MEPIEHLYVTDTRNCLGSYVSTKTGHVHLTSSSYNTIVKVRKATQKLPFTEARSKLLQCLL